jgi:hypothetical protein
VIPAPTRRQGVPARQSTSRRFANLETRRVIDRPAAVPTSAEFCFGDGAAARVELAQHLLPALGDAARRCRRVASGWFGAPGWSRAAGCGLHRRSALSLESDEAVDHGSVDVRDQLTGSRAGRGPESGEVDDRGCAVGSGRPRCRCVSVRRRGAQDAACAPAARPFPCQVRRSLHGRLGDRRACSGQRLGSCRQSSQHSLRTSEPSSHVRVLGAPFSGPQCFGLIRFRWLCRS